MSDFVSASTEYMNQKIAIGKIYGMVDNRMEDQIDATLQALL